MSRSGQSSKVRVAVSGLPPSSTWTTAGLSPDKDGPPWRKEWPSILPATMNKSLSTRKWEADGTKWPGSPSKSRVTSAFAVQHIKIHWIKTCVSTVCAELDPPVIIPPEINIKQIEHLKGCHTPKLHTKIYGKSRLQLFNAGGQKKASHTLANSSISCETVWQNKDKGNTWKY